jgi:AcrR family transcriptional regulator
VQDVLDAPRGYAKGRERRREIVEHATALFGEAGYRSTSLRQIAARAGISHPGLLHHFPSKELLLGAVLEHRDEQDVAWLELDSVRGAELLGRLVALIARNAERRGIVELFATLSAEATAPDHPAHAYFVERYRGVIGSMANAFRQAGEDGVLREGVDPDEAARELVALMDGLQVQWLLDPETTDMPELVRAHIEARLSVPLRPDAKEKTW